MPIPLKVIPTNDSSKTIYNAKLKETYHSINGAVTPPDNKSRISEQYEFGSKNGYTLPGVNDPLESINRRIFAFNEVIRQYLLDPVVIGYNSVLPMWRH